MLGKIEGRRSRGQRMRWLDGITDPMDMSSKVTLLETTVASTPASRTWTNYLPALLQFLLATG